MPSRISHHTIDMIDKLSLQKNDWKTHKYVCSISTSDSTDIRTSQLSSSENFNVEFNIWSKTHGQVLSLISLMCLQTTHPDNACEVSVIFNPNAKLSRQRIQIQHIDVIPLSTDDMIRQKHPQLCNTPDDFSTIIVVKCLNVLIGELSYTRTLPCIVNSMMMRLAINEVRKWEEREMSKIEQPAVEDGQCGLSTEPHHVSRGYLIPLVNVINFGQSEGCVVSEQLV